MWVANEEKRHGFRYHSLHKITVGTVKCKTYERIVVGGDWWENVGAR